jgi:hypothetical protein
MMINVNSQERTLEHLVKLLESASWRLERELYIDGSSGFFHPAHAVPGIL